MGTRDKRVDAYIAKSADFARPILEHAREVVHAACPEVVETIKWGAPAFEYHGLLCGMAAFKAHASFGFWKHAMLLGREREPSAGMGSFGKLTSVKDLPGKRELTRLVKQAMKLNEQGVTKVREKGKAKPAPPMHPDFERALSKSRKAKACFDGLAPSHKREYLEWITEAKREETRARRIEQAIAWMAEGKPRNWKYMK
ncbi:MAG: YdeI/OmpD-associated family protein [Hyphomonas sp.]|nr:YdeI/OmpD-associated family protein [Hyphomonas sp.]